ncbi:MAG TPA: DeoR/GlpR family DNA-binding transcription regulator [Telmatospirillum sp.]|nr:DeoR/GlpR family DNA-binding transcription regulator [Telmatospirillum sp.]
MTAKPETLSARQQRIVAWIEEQGYATLEALAHHLQVSMQTVRREVICLDASGHLQRFHGGAGRTDGRVRLGYGGKSALARDAKERIAMAAAAAITDGAAVFLDVGTTVEAIARALIARKDLRIITNSLNSARIFQDHPSCSTFVLGGTLRGPDGSLVGDLTTTTLQQFKADVAIIGCSAIEADGSVMDYDVDKIAVKRAAIAGARQSCLVADAAKFTRHAVTCIAALADFTALITDTPPPANVIAALGGCRLVVA